MVCSDWRPRGGGGGGGRRGVLLVWCCGLNRMKTSPFLLILSFIHPICHLFPWAKLDLKPHWASEEHDILPFQTYSPFTFSYANGDNKIATVCASECLLPQVRVYDTNLQVNSSPSPPFPFFLLLFRRRTLRTSIFREPLPITLVL